MAGVGSHWIYNNDDGDCQSRLIKIVAIVLALRPILWHSRHR